MLLKSVDSNLTELKVLAEDAGNDRKPTNRDLQRTLLDIDIDLLKDLIGVLQPCDNTTRLVSADKSPTIYLVTAMKLKRLHHVEESLADKRVAPLHRAYVAPSLSHSSSGSYRPTSPLTSTSVTYTTARFSLTLVKRKT